MNKFQNFNEAAILYAENAFVVEKMQELFYQNINEFLDHLGYEISNLISPHNLQKKDTSGGGERYRYWWIAENDKDKDSYPQLYFNTHNPDIVAKRQVEITGYHPKATEEKLRHLADLAKQPRFETYCKPGKGDIWSLFIVQVNYPKENPVEQAAKPITDILLAMHAVCSDTIKE